MRHNIQSSIAQYELRKLSNDLKLKLNNESMNGISFHKDYHIYIIELIKKDVKTQVLQEIINYLNEKIEEFK